LEVILTKRELGLPLGLVESAFYKDVDPSCVSLAIKLHLGTPRSKLYVTCLVGK